MGAHRRSERPRSEASYGPETGTTYLLHFDRPYRHARHYVGWTQDLAARLEAHARGRGARLVQVAVNAGIGFRVARTWPESTRDREDLIKHAGGARRYCPECGVKPRDQATPQVPAGDRRPMWQADRDGQWNDGTPIIYDPDQTWEQARAARAALQIPEPGPADQAELAALDELQRQWTSKEEQVGLRDAVARAAGVVREQRAARERRAASREADRLWALADELERRAGPRPNYQREITAERAARMRARLGEDLVQDARAQNSTEARSHEPELQGAGRDAEIDRLADALPEPGIGGTTGIALSALADLLPDLVPADGPAPHAGRGPAEPLFGPRPDGTYADAIDSDIAADDGTQSEGRPRDDALLDRAAYAEAVRQAEARALAQAHIAQGERDHEAAAAARDEAQRARQARLDAVAEAYSAAAALQQAALDETPESAHAAARATAPEASTLPAGTAHAGQRGVYVRNPDAEVLGAQRELAAYEPGAPDHGYGAPECAEADPETAHFGYGHGEPQDGGRWPVLQADYGRMYIGPQAQAEAV